MKPFVWLVTDDAQVAAAHARTLNPARLLSTTSRKQMRDVNQILVHDLAAQEEAGLEFVFGSSYGRRRGEEVREFLTARAGDMAPDSVLVFVTVVTSPVLEQLKLGWKFRFSEISEVDRKWVAECEGQLLASKTVFEASSVALVNDNGGATAVQYIKYPKGYRSSVRSSLGNQKNKYLTNEGPRQSNLLGERGAAGRRQSAGGLRGTPPVFKERGAKADFKPRFPADHEGGLKREELHVITAATTKVKLASHSGTMGNAPAFAEVPPKQPKKKVRSTTVVSDEKIDDWKSRLAERFDVK